MEWIDIPEAFKKPVCFPRSSNDKRRAFTIIELLVITSVIGILSMLLLAAVQAARESARHSVCTNNLRQFSIALNAYCASTNVFPGGTNGRGFSLHVALLPHLEQSALFNSINFDTTDISFAPYSDSNLTARLSQIAVFICPSDARGLDSKKESNNNYIGNRGNEYRFYGATNEGVFPGGRRNGRPIAPADVQDGTANTAAMSEWLRFDDVFSTPFIKGPNSLGPFLTLCSQSSSISCVRKKPSNWMCGNFLNTLYNHLMSPNSRSCTNATNVYSGAWTAGSAHGGGINVMFVDGHVEFTKDTISLGVWRAIGTRSGGEVF